MECSVVSLMNVLIPKNSKKIKYSPKAATVHATLKPTLDLKPLWIINRGLSPNLLV